MNSKTSQTTRRPLVTRSHSLQAGFLAAAFITGSASAQNVGIGTTTPKSKLSVNGSTASGGMAIGDATYTSTTGTVAPLNGAIIQGFTGIGTTSPLWRLTLEGDGTPQSSTLLVNSKASPPTGAAVPEVVLRVSDNSALTTNAIFGRYLVQSLPGAIATTGWDAIHRGFSSGNAMTAMRFLTAAGGGAAERMRIDEDGNVGIGDTDPGEARLVVRGGPSGGTGSNRQFTSGNTALVLDSNGMAFGVSIYASNTIMAEGNMVAGNAIVAAASVTPSDVRLKNVVGKSDSASDLEKLGKIEVTDYTMKDPKVLGSGVIKKVIAQQVEEVFPSAVTRGSGYLPDVRATGTATAKGEGLFEITLEAPHGLSAGETVKLFSASGEPEFAKVETAGLNSFTAKLGLVSDGEKVFVHGRKVEDLRTVDYDAISMLNVSATQELAKENIAQEARIAALEAENRQMKEKMVSVEAIAARLEALEKGLVVAPSSPGQTVSTGR